MVNEHFITEYIATLKSCVIDASKEIMDVYKSDDFGEINKSDGSPLTLADKRANELILERLKFISSSIPVISEETFNQDSLLNLNDIYWLVDPLDGTKEFIKKNGEFTVNIALIENNKPILGAIYTPVKFGTESISFKLSTASFVSIIAKLKIFLFAFSK